MKTIALIIIAKNEENNISACLESAQGLDEFIVIDDFSSDNTKHLAESLGAKVYQRNLNGDYAQQRNFALTKVESSWVFYLDADERLNSEAVKELRAHVKENYNLAAKIKRYNYAFGKIFKYGALKSDWVLRFFPKNEVIWKGLVHESAQTTLNIRSLKNTLKHYTYSSWHNYFEKMNIYSDIWAQEAFLKNKKTNYLSILAHSFWAFFNMYFLKRGFLDGFLGFVSAYYYSSYTMAKYVKLKEKYKIKRKLKEN